MRAVQNNFRVDKPAFAQSNMLRIHKILDDETTPIQRCIGDPETAQLEMIAFGRAYQSTAGNAMECAADIDFPRLLRVLRK